MLSIGLSEFLKYCDDIEKKYVSLQCRITKKRYEKCVVFLQWVERVQVLI